MSSRSKASRRAMALMPEDGSVTDWTARIGAWRDRPCHVLGHHFRPESSLTGLLVATDRADYIIAESHAGPSRRLLIVCHEIAHLLLGHCDAGDFSIPPPLGVDLVVPGQVIATRSCLDDQREQDAERVGTVLAIKHRRRREVFSEADGIRLR